jgi:hypothetical protein
MGNTLVFVCPHCGHEGEKSVIQTDVLAAAIVSGDGGAEIRGRTRQRSCGNCKSQFKTSEISTGALDDLVARDQLATNLIGRLQTAPNSIASDDPMRVEAIGCLRVLNAVFGGGFSPRWESIYPLSEGDCATIIYRVSQALNLLDAESSEAIKHHFGVLLGDLPRAIPVEQDTLERSLRKLKHPSRSRTLRHLTSFID